jgi:hypothetical protein
VQIPAYRDRELATTLIDLYEKARNPGQLRVSVLWQRSGKEALPDAVRKLPRLDLVEVPFERSRGCNWARRQVQRRWTDEPYTLLVDSHHRFIEGWDTLLVGMHQDLLARGVSRPIITAYMPRYDPANDPGARQITPFRIYPKGYEAGLLIHLTSYPIRNWFQLKGPVPARFVSGHFIFAGIVEHPR